MIIHTQEINKKNITLNKREATETRREGLGGHERLLHAVERVVRAGARPLRDKERPNPQSEIRGNHLSNTTCLTQVFFNNNKLYSNLW